MPTDPRRVDALVALAYLAGGLLLYAFDLGRLAGTRGTPGVGVAQVAVLVVMCALVCLRRSCPVTALALAVVPLVADIAMSPTLPVWLAVGDLLYCATLYGPRWVGRLLVVVTGALSVALAVLGGWYVQQVQGAVVGAAIGVLLAFTPVVWGLTVRTHRQAAQAERARADAERARADAERDNAATERARAQAQQRAAELDQAAAVGAERQRLARDLHDIIAGHLSAIALQSEAVLRVPRPDDPARQAVLESVRATSVAALKEMQSMIVLLRGEESADAAVTAPRLGDLPALVAAHRADGTVVEVVGDADGLDAQVDLTAYRICQEALTNARRHAPGVPVRIRLGLGPDELRVHVSNPSPDQAGAASGTGHGLRNMAERAAAVGGRFDAGREAGGWHVRAWLPRVAGRTR